MDKGHEEIARSLMLSILYDNGFIDRWHPELSQISDKWLKKIAPIAGDFFDKYPDLLTDENIQLIGEGGADDELVEVIFKDYPEIKNLNDILNEYFDDGCGVE